MNLLSFMLRIKKKPFINLNIKKITALILNFLFTIIWLTSINLLIKWITLLHKLINLKKYSTNLNNKSNSTIRVMRILIKIYQWINNNNNLIQLNRFLKFFSSSKIILLLKRFYLNKIKCAKTKSKVQLIYSMKMKTIANSKRKIEMIYMKKMKKNKIKLLIRLKNQTKRML